MKKNLLRVVLLCAALALLVAGGIGGGYTMLHRKASLICMECIGLG